LLSYRAMVALLPDADHLHHQPKFGRKKCRTVLFTSLAARGG